ncbi:TetR family transcriptional regulator [Homoserinimonas aerilata]|uniref:TetR family transcriptional regulator n=1 Tax=Homoserinimonas aerilata TaxID=1162970 RepID=A0A542YL72_9MICO|nr:TetR family transcriptional regulator [Homoserinimonas aerilata]
MNEPATVRGPYRNGIERRAEIIAKASEVFGTYGYVAGSLRQIATEVGITPAAITRHFDSKEDLLAEVIRAWTTKSSQALGPSATGLTHFERLIKLMEFNHAHRGFLELFLTLSTEASNPDHPARRFITERYEQTLTNFMSNLGLAVRSGAAKAMTPSEIEAESREVIAMMDGLEIQWLLNPEVDLLGLFASYIRRTLERWRAPALRSTP